MSKSWLNSFLDNPRRKIIWIVNWTDLMDESVKRRFAFSIRFDRFSTKERRRLWETCAKDKGVSIAPELIGKLANEFDASAAGIAQAIDILESARSTAKDIPDEKALRAALRSQERLIRGEASAALPPIVASYDPEIINCDTSVPTMLKALRSWQAKGDEKDRRGLRFLFWGPPGTGKTELCKHLAKESELGLVQKRASELLSMFVGGTEKNVASAFAEAARSNSILLLDEADSFLRSRASASRSWEVTEVNEFLTQIESFPGILVACTNSLESLDHASLRRFQFKIGFDLLRQEGLAKLLGLLWPRIEWSGDSAARIESLAGTLSIGDVAATAGRLEYSGEEPDAAMVLEELEKERVIKAPRARIGFGA
jgi:transitional endoplasmic reticulum ATPase